MVSPAAGASTKAATKEMVSGRAAPDFTYSRARRWVRRSGIRGRCATVRLSVRASRKYSASYIPAAAKLRFMASSRFSAMAGAQSAGERRKPG